MLSTPPACPVCAHADRSYKISLLYLEASARLNHRESTNQPELDAVLVDVLPENCTDAEQTQVLNRMVTMFAPPSGQRQVTRRIHPDWMILFLFGIGLFIIFQIAKSQPGGLPVFVSLVGASLLAYLLLRKPILSRYDGLLAQERADKSRVERAVARWMRLYYCSRDQIIFDPEENRFVPLEQIADLVNV